MYCLNPYRLTNDQTFQWKALRLLARRSPQFFTNSATPALELKVYLNSMMSKLAKQMPVSEGFSVIHLMLISILLYTAANIATLSMDAYQV